VISLVPERDGAPNVDVVKSIVELGQTIHKAGMKSNIKIDDTIRLIGSLFHNAPSWEPNISQAAAARLGCSQTNFNWSHDFTLSTEDMLDELEMVSSSVDILLTTYMDSKGLGVGRELTEQFAKRSHAPLINMIDEVFSTQFALAELMGFDAGLGELAGKRIAITWGFGSRFDTPSVAHSLVTLAGLFEMNTRIVAPEPFSLLRRVIRNASEYASSNGLVVEEVSEMQSAFEDVDAVFTLNWSCLNNYQKPERNSETAQGLEEWSLDVDTIPERCVFSTLPPAQADLIATVRLLNSDQNITSSWLSRRISVLMASIIELTQKDKEELPMALL
jgi:ornithine carbamoyltransferase